MAAKKAKESKTARRGSYYKLDGDKVTTDKKYCPRCGPGIIMGGHKDRAACGKCGYTEFNK